MCIKYGYSGNVAYTPFYIDTYKKQTCNLLGGHLPKSNNNQPYGLLDLICQGLARTGSLELLSLYRRTK